MSLQICKPDDAVEQLIKISGHLAAKGWLPATSGNLSVLLERDPLLMAVTASGVDKEFLAKDDIVLVDGNCRNVQPGNVRKPSFETQIHRLIYDNTAAGCVLHVHTVFNNLAGEWADQTGNLRIRGIELIKALGIWDEDAEIRVPVVENYADIAELTETISNRFSGFDPQVPCILLRSHGVYVWGTTWMEAKKHLQAFEFMFEYITRAGGSLPMPVKRS